ncbi:MAG: hypothetical protein ABSE50_11795, partial [Xanthobacteraceae bacterium]
MLIGWTMISGKLGIIEITGAPLIQIEEKVAVEPLKVEQEHNRLADTDVGKNLPSGIEDEIGSEFGQTAWKSFLADAAVVHCRE